MNTKQFKKDKKRTILIKKAYKICRDAIKRGILQKGCCEIVGCDNPNTVPHHDNYSKPLKVRWFCASHHAKHHYKQWKIHGKPRRVRINSKKDKKPFMGVSWRLPPEGVVLAMKK